jgi:hypothetical protein
VYIFALWKRNELFVNWQPIFVEILICVHFRKVHLGKIETMKNLFLAIAGFSLVLFACSVTPEKKESQNDVLGLPEVLSEPQMTMFRFLELGMKMDEVTNYVEKYTEKVSTRNNDGLIIFDWVDLNNVNHKLICMAFENNMLEGITYRLNVPQNDENGVLKYQNALVDLFTEVYGAPSDQRKDGPREFFTWNYEDRFIELMRDWEGVMVTFDYAEFY